MRGPGSPAQCGDRHHQPRAAEGHTPDPTLPEFTLRPCPRAAGRPGPPLSTPRQKAAVVERKRGEGGRDLGCQGTRKQGVENISGGAGRPQKWQCASPRLHGPGTSASVHRTSLTQHKFKERRSKNFQTLIHRSLASIKPQAQGLCGHGALGGYMAACP